MAHVVFLRAANVGGHNTFKPAALARELSALDVINVGAAGTFVARGKVSTATLRDEMRQRLTFDTEMIIRPAAEVLALAESDPFASFGEAGADGVRRFVSALVKPQRFSEATLPLSRPEGELWQVRLVAVRGPFVLSLHRNVGRSPLYPNAVAEKAFGTAATTRGWNTIEAIVKVLQRR